MSRSASSRFYRYLTAFCFWSAPLYVFAAVCTTNPVVTNTSDSGAGSLRDVLATACDSSTITFSNSTSGGATNFYDGTARTITLTSGELLLTRNITITGPGSDQLAISGNDASRIFFIKPGAPGATSGPPATSIGVDLSGLALVHGKAKGGNGESAVCAGGAGGAAGMGGAIFVNNAALALSGMTFNNNQALGGTGGTSLSGTFCTSGGGGGGVGGNGSNGTGGGGGALGG